MRTEGARSSAITYSRVLPCITTTFSVLYLRIYLPFLLINLVCIIKLRSIFNRLWAQVYAKQFNNILFVVHRIVMAAIVAHNALRDVGHIVKFNGENHHEWKCEVLSMLEQLGLKNLLIIPTGGVLSTLPANVII